MNIRVKAIVLIFSGLCSLGSLNGQIPMGVTHSGQSTSQAPFPLTVHGTQKSGSNGRGILERPFRHSLCMGRHLHPI
mgnify:CR=1 FL=1